MDTDSIRAGDNWQTSITNSLEKADVIIPIIGEYWLKAPDRAGRRRLDNPDDWVANEIAYGLKGNAVVIPVLIDETRMPQEEMLPEVLRELPGCQAIRIRKGTFPLDRELLFRRLEELGFRRVEGKINYPVPVIKLDQFEDEEIERAGDRLPDWRRVSRNNSKAVGGRTDELYRKFAFSSFREVVNFIMMASRDIEQIAHHPDWHNVYQELEIWLCTWDVGHRITDLDIKLAQRFDALYDRHFRP